MTFAAYLVRLGNSGGVYTTITHTDDMEQAEKAVRHHIATRQRVLGEIAQERALSPQEAAFITWDAASAQPVKILALAGWRGEFGDVLPIFQPTSLAAWSFDRQKTVSGRVSIHEVSPAHLSLACDVCGAVYSGNAADYWQLPDEHVFTCDCGGAPTGGYVCTLIAPNGAEIHTVARLSIIRAWEKENSI